MTLRVVPGGKLPEFNKYLTVLLLLALTAAVDTLTELVSITVPKLPAAVLQIGVALKEMPGTYVAVAPSGLYKYSM
jgi:hypothetical protein